MSKFSENSSGKRLGRIPKPIRPLFEMGTEAPTPPEVKQEMEHPQQEAQRIVKRVAAIVEDHRQAAISLKISLNTDDLRAVIHSLREHARGGAGTPVSGGRDEIHSYCLDRLFEELVEEPSNILFTTQKGNDAIRYDAMNASFWLECLDLFEQTYCTLK